MAWPPNDAEDVPLDTPLVVWRYNVVGPTDDIGYAVIGDDGNAVATMEVHRLPAAWVGCGGTEVVFVRPEKPFVPHATYRMTIGVNNHDFGSVFTTGAAMFKPEAKIDAKLQYLLVTPSDCQADTCDRLAEAHIDLGARPVVPRWFRVESAAVADGRNAFTFWPQDDRTGSSWQLSVMLRDDDTCIDAAVYGIEGVPLFRKHLCEPDGCARFDRWGGSTCGDPPSSGVDATRIAGGTCDDPPMLGFKTGEGIVYPQNGKDVAGGSTDAHSASDGCSTTRTSAAASTWGWFVMALLAVVLRKLRAARLRP